jgi:hypothetical protein
MASMTSDGLRAASCSLVKHLGRNVANVYTFCIRHNSFDI